MADWKQIRARIRRAKAGPDATTRLEQLFDKTRDGMVAFELALLEEAAGRFERAIDWYKHAWQRFRRSEWKQKAEEALTRHGVAIPAALEEPALRAPADELAPPEMSGAPAPGESAREPAAALESDLDSEEEVRGAPARVDEPERGAVGGLAGAREIGTGHRRRRRRGGRGRGRGKDRQEAPSDVESEERPRTVARPPLNAAAPRPREAEPPPAEDARPARAPLPAIHVYRRAEPALASEIKALEAKLRQLLASHPHQLDQLNEVPASPGVYLVSDTDLTTTYYLEACRNMRSASDQLLSGRRGRQGSVRAGLARYLGISDGQATRYLKQHCAVRWMELEETDAVALGHFATALLRPELMDESA